MQEYKVSGQYSKQERFERGAMPEDKVNIAKLAER